MSTRKYFGTDGIRGKVGESLIEPEFVLKLGWAIGKVLASSGRGKVLIGKDTRISGYMLESALEAGLSAAGCSSLLLGPMPTPAIAYLTRTFHADAGIVVSASHNPFEDNGIKIFGAGGKKLPDEVEAKIESMIDQPLKTVASQLFGKAKRVEDAKGRYIEFCKSTIPYGLTLSGLKIVLDCANGATYHVAPQVFSELGAEVEVIANKPNGLNINEKCGATDPSFLREKVLETKADLGLAFDGDGDRLILIDHVGERVDGDEILLMITDYFISQEISLPGIVGTQMSNLGLEKAIADRGLQFIRTKVGDRYILAELEARGWVLGGEASGHIICLRLSPSGDGIISALQVLAYLTQKQKSLHELKKGMIKYPQILINVKVSEPQKCIDNKKVQQALESAESQMGSQGRILLRASGTEPLVRVMVEGEEKNKVTRVAEQLSAVIKEIA